MRLFISCLCSLFVFVSAVAQETVIQVDSEMIGAPLVRFILNDDYLVLYVLAQSRASGQFAEDVTNFQNDAWKDDQKTYQALQKYAFINPSELQRPEFQKKFGTFISKQKQKSLFVKIRGQTLDYLNASVAEWKLNLEKSAEFIMKYSGFSFQFVVDAYLTHPAVGNGMAHDFENRILSFGAWPSFPNYFTVYIWHEILHFQMGRDDLSHAAIQLIADNELRLFLGGGSLLPLQGHAEHLLIMSHNLSAWEKYKQSPTNLNTFSKSMSTPAPQK